MLIDALEKVEMVATETEKVKEIEKGTSLY